MVHGMMAGELVAMVVRASAFNPKILAWARERAGLSVEELAELIKKDASVVADWEQSSDPAPTFRQLENIAKKLKRPVALFFFSTPPAEPEPDTEFRMLPEAVRGEEAKDTRFAIRDAFAKQVRILELSGGENPSGTEFLFRGTIRARATSIRSRLGIDLQRQLAWNNANVAFKEWRDAFETVGVFVFKRAFKQMEVSGFCLPHPVVPVIVVNNRTSWTRQVFTLFHELAHLIYRHHGVTRADPGYLRELPARERQVEIMCNKFAGEFLVPPDDFRNRSASFGGDDKEIEELAAFYKVSREVVLRRLIDEGRVDHSVYDSKAAEWNRAFFARVGKPGPGGGDYYATQASYLGRAYLALAFASFHAGHTSLSQLAEHLGVKARNVDGLEEFVTRHAK